MKIEEPMPDDLEGLIKWLENKAINGTYEEAIKARMTLEITAFIFGKMKTEKNGDAEQHDK